MKNFRDFLKEQFQDKDFEAEFYRGLEKTRLAAQIAYYREKRGLTQSKLAELLNTSQSTIARLENPNYHNYSVKTLRKIAKILNLELVVSLREKNIEEEKIELDDYESTGNFYYITWIPKNRSDYSLKINRLINKDKHSQKYQIKKENAA
ncbi:helix-turn-helix transcriptional regulator [Thermodesulfovibrio sp. 3907-1M]|uniref:Helix-turn-helix transcriptional regulator n=1 Tax=Thermodesulfovibrio autotrophicus TaxID=3118333 RepID=A0AAU8H1A3_9BACT